MQLNLSTLAKHFSDEEAAWTFLERIKWPNGPICPHCGSVDHAYFLQPRTGKRTTSTGKRSYRRIWKCADCRQPFSVLVGTVMEHSHILVSKWLLAIHMLNAGKNGMAALELSRILGIGYRAAWFMAHRIRYGMATGQQPSKLKGTVEADETYLLTSALAPQARGYTNRLDECDPDSPWRGWPRS